MTTPKRKGTPIAPRWRWHAKLVASLMAIDRRPKNFLVVEKAIKFILGIFETTYPESIAGPSHHGHDPRNISVDVKSD